VSGQLHAWAKVTNIHQSVKLLEYIQKEIFSPLRAPARANISQQLKTLLINKKSRYFLILKKIEHKNYREQQ
jgi:hypothetical protein